MMTAHLVHYSGSHLVANLFVLLPAMLLAEMECRKDLLRVLAVSSVAIGITVFVFEPQLLRYAGASGIALALVCWVALRGLAGNRRWRAVCSAVLVLVGIKLIAEIGFGWRWLDWGHESGIVTVTIAHLVGVVSGLSIWLAQTAKGASASFSLSQRSQIDRV